MMPDKEKHSPLPWKEAHIKGSGIIVCNEGHKVMIFLTPEGNEELYYANIDYVLHCVNTHDKLLAK